jgi:hypothetical protein
MLCSLKVAFRTEIALAIGRDSPASPGHSGLLCLDLKSAADPSEAKADPINRRDWHDPQPRHEQGLIGARDGLIAVELKNPCKD